MNRKLKVLAALLTASAMLCGCSEDKKSGKRRNSVMEDEPSSSAVIPDPSASETTSGSGSASEVVREERPEQTTVTQEDRSAVPELETQFDLIASHTDEWISEDQYGDIVYAVTDLDGNGRLEIIQLNSDEYSTCYIQIFQVVWDGEHLSRCNYVSSFVDGASYPNMVQSDPVLYYENDDSIVYVFHSEYGYPGERTLFTETLELKNGDILFELIAILNETESGTIYYDTDYNELSQDAYDERISDFDGSPNFRNFGWFHLNEETLEQDLRSSYEVFSTPVM